MEKIVSFTCHWHQFASKTEAGLSQETIGSLREQIPYFESFIPNPRKDVSEGVLSITFHFTF